MNPYLEVVLSALLFGSGGIFVKVVDLPAASMSFFRVGVPTLILAVYFFCYKINVFKSVNKTVIFISIINALRIFLWQFAYLNTSIGNAVIILYTWPIFTVLLEPVFVKEKLTIQKLSLALFAFVGIVIIFSGKEFSFANRDFLGMFAMLVAAVLTAVIALLFKPEVKRFSKTQLIFYQNVAGAILFLPFLITTSPSPTLRQIILSSIYAALTGLIAFLMWFSALKKIRTSTLAIISYIEVVSAIALGVLVLKQEITLNMAIGGMIILIVSYFVRKNEKPIISE